MDVIVVFVVAVGFFVIVAAFIFSTILKRKNETWTGTLKDKRVEEEIRRSDGDKRKVEMHYLYVELADGTKKKISVGQRLWETFSVGDRIEKKSGSYNPNKV